MAAPLTNDLIAELYDRLGAPPSEGHHDCPACSRQLEQLAQAGEGGLALHTHPHVHWQEPEPGGVGTLTVTGGGRQFVVRDADYDDALAAAIHQVG